jgi:hypothetical protein
MSNTEDNVFNVVLLGEGGNLFPTLLNSKDLENDSNQWKKQIPSNFGHGRKRRFEN